MTGSCTFGCRLFYSTALSDSNAYARGYGVWAVQGLTTSFDGERDDGVVLVNGTWYQSVCDFYSNVYFADGDLLTGSPEIDAPIRSARAFGTMACVLSLTVLFLLLLLTCFSFGTNKVIFIIAAVLSLTTGVFTFLTLVSFTPFPAARMF